MPWFINILIGIIIGGIIFNAKMRKGFMGFLDGMAKKKDKPAEKSKGARYVVVDGKRYRLEEDEE